MNGPGPRRTVSTESDIMKTRIETASERFLSGYNCAQSVLEAYSDVLNLPKDTALRLASGLGAGLARRGEMCGAVTGGILALGLKFGRGEREDRSANERTYARTQELIAAFEQRHGTCQCRALLRGCDLRTEDGQRRFREQDLLHKTCLPCVRSVVEFLAPLLEEPPAPAARNANA